MERDLYREIEMYLTAPGEQSISPPLPRAEEFTLLGESMITIKAVIGSVQMRAQDFIALSPADQLALDGPLSVSLQVGGEEIAVGSLTVEGGRAIIKIIQETE